jgi:hypothetical protein
MERQKKLKYFNQNSKNIGRDSKGTYTELKPIFSDVCCGSQVKVVKSNSASTPLNTGHTPRDDPQRGVSGAVRWLLAMVAVTDIEV